MRTVSFRVFIVVCALVLFSFPAYTQSTAAIRGLATDESGAVVTGARIDLSNPATGQNWTYTTDAGGQYVFSQLKPGEYRIRVVAAGFRAYVRDGIVLQVGQQAGIDVRLSLGAVTESVQVSASAPLLETSEAGLGQVIENRKILDLPLNGRNILSLTSLTTGVNPGTGFGGGIPYGRAALIQAAASNVSINGGPTSSNDVLVDGVPLSVCCQNQIAFLPSIDATQEFRVRANMYDAQFGRTGGGVITFASRGGSNEFHGSVFHFLRNDNLDANNFFNNRAGTRKAHFVYNQFGGRIGGPIVKNRLFFFGNYEGIRNVRGFFETGRTPTAAERAGTFAVAIYDPLTGDTANNFTRGPFPNNTIPRSRFDPVSVNLISFWPQPNAPGALNFISNAPNSDISNQYNARIDFNVTERHRLFGRFSVVKNSGAMPDTYGNIASIGWDQKTNTINGVLDHSWTVSTSFLVNLRYGFTRQADDRVGYSLGIDITQYGWPPSFSAARQEALLPEIRVTNHLGLSRGTLFKRSGQTHAAVANISKIAGRQYLKFGGEFRAYQQHWRDNGNASGNFNFNTGFTRGPNALTGGGGNEFASFLLGYMSSGSLANIGSISSNSPYYALYIQDDIRVNQSLTLNLGLRWEVELSRNERYDRLSYFDPNAESPLAAMAAVPGLRGGLGFLSDSVPRQQETNWNNFGPRFGFSWQAAPRTVLRGGYGITFLPIQTRYNGTLNTGFSATTSVTTSIDGGRTPSAVLNNPFPQGFNVAGGASEGLLSSLGQSFSVLLRDEEQTGYSQQWSFNIQREVNTDLLVDLAYSGSKGTQLPMRLALNALPSELLAQGTRLLDPVPNPFARFISTGPLAAATVTRRQLLLPYPHFQGITSNTSQMASSTYHSMQVRVNKRFSQGFSVLGAYTFGKLISDFGGWNTNFLDAVPLYQDVYNRRLDKSIDPQDISQRLVISYVWELPLGRGKHFLAGIPRGLDLVIGGWQINGITTLASGQPLVLTNTIATTSGATRPHNKGSSARRTGSNSDLIGEWFNKSVFSAPGPFEFGSAPRTLPDVRGDGANNFDISFFKNFVITERIGLQFRGEFFNIFNSPQFAEPNGAFGNAAFGSVTAQLNDPRDVQLALRLTF